MSNLNEKIDPNKITDKNYYLSDVIKLKRNQSLETFKGLKNEIRDDVKKISHTDIHFDVEKMNGGVVVFSVKLPVEIQTKINKIFELYSEFEHDVPGSVTDNGNLMYPGEWQIYVNIEGVDKKNRIHFPTALPKELRGIGFGYKIYKAVAFELGFISTDSQATIDAQLVWRRLITEDNDFNACTSNDFSFIIDKTLPKNTKLKIVKSVLKSYVNPYKLMRSQVNLLFDDELIKEIGVAKYSPELIRRLLKRKSGTSHYDQDFKVGDYVRGLAFDPASGDPNNYAVVDENMVMGIIVKVDDSNVVVEPLKFKNEDQTNIGKKYSVWKNFLSKI